MTLLELSEKCANLSYEKGFYCPVDLQMRTNIEHRDLMLGKLMLIVTEIAEAAEDVRRNDIDHFWLEIADAFIRLLDICGRSAKDIEPVIRRTLEKNAQRPERHGKASSL